MMMNHEQWSIPRPEAVYRTGLAALCLAVSGILFVLYPALRPFSDEASLQGAQAFASPFWVLAHILAIIGFILMVLGLGGWHLVLTETPVERPAFRALVVTGLGVGLLLPYYGLEAFSVHAVGQAAVRQNSPALMTLANTIRTGPGLIMFVAGLLLLTVGAILVGIATWRSEVMPRWSGVPFAVAFALYIPQFFANQPLRIVHGLLVAAGCLWIAAVMWQRRSPRDTEQQDDQAEEQDNQDDHDDHDDHNEEQDDHDDQGDQDEEQDDRPERPVATQANTNPERR
jgi:hypothetical protein